MNFIRTKCKLFNASLFFDFSDRVLNIRSFLERKQELGSIFNEYSQIISISQRGASPSRQNLLKSQKGAVTNLPFNTRLFNDCQKNKIYCYLLIKISDYFKYKIHVI